MKGVIDEEKYWEQGVYVSQISPHAVPFEEIQKMTYDYFKTFYLRPGKLLDEILKTFRSRYRMTALFSNIIRVGEILKTVRRETNLEPIKASS